MAEGGTKRGLTSEQWSEVRAAFEAGESIAKLSKRFGATRETIAAHRDRDGWVIRQDSRHKSGREEAKNVRDRITSNVIDIATKRGVQKAEDSGVIDAVVEEIAATVTAKRLASEFMVELMTKAREGRIKPAMSPGEQTEADVGKTVMAAWSLFSKTLREDEGRVPGQPTVGSADLGGAAQKVEFVIIDAAEKTGTHDA